MSSVWYRAAVVWTLAFAFMLSVVGPYVCKAHAGEVKMLWQSDELDPGRGALDILRVPHVVRRCEVSRVAASEGSVYAAITYYVEFGKDDIREDPFAQQSVLVAFDRDTGRIRWAHPMEPATVVSIVEGVDRVYLASSDGAVECLERTPSVGRSPLVHWKMTTGRSMVVTCAYGTCMGIPDLRGAPREFLLVHRHPGRLAALDAATGTALWECQDIGNLDFAGQMRPGKLMCISDKGTWGRGGTLAMVNLADGKALWNYGPSTSGAVSVEQGADFLRTYRLADGRIVKEGKGIMAFDWYTETRAVAVFMDGGLVDLDATTGAPIAGVVRIFPAAPLSLRVFGEKVVGVFGDESLRRSDVESDMSVQALDMASGKAAWDISIPAAMNYAVDVNGIWVKTKNAMHWIAGATGAKHTMDVPQGLMSSGPSEAKAGRFYFMRADRRLVCVAAPQIEHSQEQKAVVPTK